MSACVDQLANGSISQLARQTRLSRRTILDCRRGEQLLTLGNMIGLCWCIDVSPLRLLLEEALTIEVIPRVVVRLEPSRQSTSHFRPFSEEDVKQILEAQLANTTEPPQSMRVIAARLGYDQSYLLKKLPLLCRAISLRYLNHVKNLGQERRKHLLDELKEVILALHAQDIYPGFNQITEHISQPWLMREPNAKMVWRQMLSHLGWEVER